MFIVRESVNIASLTPANAPLVCGASFTLHNGQCVEYRAVREQFAAYVQDVGELVGAVDVRHKREKRADRRHARDVVVGVGGRRCSRRRHVVRPNLQLLLKPRNTVYGYAIEEIDLWIAAVFDLQHGHPAIVALHPNLHVTHTGARLQVLLLQQQQNNGIGRRSAKSDMGHVPVRSLPQSLVAVAVAVDSSWLACCGVHCQFACPATESPSTAARTLSFVS